MSRQDFAEALTRAMKRYPDMADYLKEMNRVAARFDAVRDPKTKNWVLPSGQTVSADDLAVVYAGGRLSPQDDLSFLE